MKELCPDCRNDPERHFLPGGAIADYCHHRDVLEVRDTNTGQTVSLSVAPGEIHESLAHAERIHRGLPVVQFKAGVGHE